MDFVSCAGKYHHKIGINNIQKENPTSDQVKELFLSSAIQK